MGIKYQRQVVAGAQCISGLLLFTSLIFLIENISRSFDSPSRRLLEEEDDESTATRKTFFYLTFFSITGTCLFKIQAKILDQNDKGEFARWLRSFSMVQYCCLPPQKVKKTPNEEEPEELDTLVSSKSDRRTLPKKRKEDDVEEFSIGLLMFMVLGLVTSYILWGIFQERIMTKPYESLSTGEMDNYADAEFLVFCNRFLGLGAGWLGMYLTAPHDKFAPPFLFAFCSMSNILSSWFQYESLKFITFPMQVLAKSCKIVATMGMGKLLNGKVYQWIELINVFVITAGLFVFKYGQSAGHTDDAKKGDLFVLGMVLISCYIFCDSFTSNWQERIYKTYSIHSFQMMLGVNMWSVTISFLLCMPRFPFVLAFCFDHPLFSFHAMCMSICSAVGQLFIFYTIKKFGAVVFATAMTTRSIMSVILSIILFNHPITGIGCFGMFISFSGLIWKVQIKRAAVAKKNAAKREKARRQAELSREQNV